MLHIYIIYIFIICVSRFCQDNFVAPPLTYEDSFHNFYNDSIFIVDTKSILTQRNIESCIEESLSRLNICSCTNLTQLIATLKSFDDVLCKNNQIRLLMVEMSSLFPWPQDVEGRFFLVINKLPNFTKISLIFSMNYCSWRQFQQIDISQNDKVSRSAT